MNQITDFNIKDKRVFIRADLNVPMRSGNISSTNRIQASLPTIKYALKSGAKVMITSHLGRPEEGYFNEEDSLAPVAHYLSQILDMKIPLIKDWTIKEFTVESGEMVVLENCRFNVGEKENDTVLSKTYADLTDIFVMDAFGTAHRKQASTYGIAEFCPQVCAGMLFAKELEALDKVMSIPKSPMVAIVGGSKVSTKLKVLDSLSDKVDQLILGGGIANTFLKAQGYNIGMSLCEDEFIPSAKKIIQKLESRGATLPVVTDVVCGKKFHENEVAVVKNIKNLESDDIIFDLGPISMISITKKIKQARTILWNGPIGVFEFKQFSKGTETLALAVANSMAFSLAGGGDTIAAIEAFGMEKNISYVSTAGGAFLEFVEGKKLHAIEILERRTG
ncbi:MAG: phosphoglycerate kinase [Methylophilaceae bacterium]|jgi:phosphoglycerate kinase|nr:phosphoglycerate kinase [Methylophilaceae bacterium]